VAGAKWFGYPTFWVDRAGSPGEELGVTPDGTGKSLEQKDSLTGETVLFDLRFRKKLEQVRREQTRRSKLNSALEKRPEIEMIGDYGDFLAVRIDGRCWKTLVSVYTTHPPFSVW